MTQVPRALRWASSAVGAVDRSGGAGFSSVGPTADGRMKPEVAAIGVAVKIVALLLQAHPAYSVDDVLLDLRATRVRPASRTISSGGSTRESSSRSAF